MKSDSLASIRSTKAKLPEQGWAMKKSEKAPRMKEEIKNEIKKYFKTQRGQGRRALAREICPMLREMKDKKTGKYLFDLIDCPKETQCQSVISTLLKEEVTATIESLPKKGKRSRKSNEEQQFEEVVYNI